jgi:hypothetical protein
MPQAETCNSLDDNCNGQIDEGLSVGNIVYTNVVTALFPVCSSSNLVSANLNNGYDSPIIEGAGLDRWYKLTAQYNALRVGLSAASGDNSIFLYHDNGYCLTLVHVEHEVTQGPQTLICDDLIPGEMYYVAVHQNAGPTNISAKLCLNHFVPSICDHVYSGNTGVYPNVCSSFKAVFRANASQYIFNVSSASQGGANLNITPWSYTTPNASSIISRLGTLLPANFEATPKVYTIEIPVIYNIPDAAGNFTTIIAQPTQTCTVTLNQEAPVVLKSADRCPTLKAINQSISTDRAICRAVRYEWEFTQILPIAADPILVLGGLNTNALFLNNVPNIGVGKTYNVRVRPIHSTGEIGAFGQAYCLKTSGSGMMAESSSMSSLPLDPSEQEFTIYPNPSLNASVSIAWNQWTDDVQHIRVTDLNGRVLWKNEIVLQSNVYELDVSSLSSGVYFIEINNHHQRWIITK